MMIIPAVDILDKKVVQLVGGVPGTEKITMPDPVEAAGMWISKGAKALHIIDLDGAFGKENNISVIKEIIKKYNVPTEVGGGIKDERTIKELLDGGASGVIVGTRAIKDNDWLREMASLFPKKLILALDTKNGRIAVKGWQDSAQMTVKEMFRIIKDIPLAGVLNTNVDVEGLGKGIDEEQARSFISGCPHPVIASGGISSYDDVKKLRSAGAVAAVVGVSIYTGIMEPWKWSSPWISNI
ncbi:MAG: 1-(5-phosphoribosyl)-5-[(5-phosphoribosylamino)methylideneamino] imidazole-4-carboxamide isomerase [Methanomassiliicoccaceae archaeon]|nr:1-(5-phosphoribosyl)-5-[(5-phosphoribosylamino)methylideneamino] imidazole-4-carboxamide isomerase [Methanomassiliicoccaceae archaeon]